MLGYQHPAGLGTATADLTDDSNSSSGNSSSSSSNSSSSSSSSNGNEQQAVPLAYTAAGAAAVATLAASDMRCGGCGSKVGPAVLGQVMQQLRSSQQSHCSSSDGSRSSNSSNSNGAASMKLSNASDSASNSTIDVTGDSTTSNTVAVDATAASAEQSQQQLQHQPSTPKETDATTTAAAAATKGRVLIGLSSADDAAVVLPPTAPHTAMVHTVDYFRAHVSDPYMFGRIAANHALSDAHAMGAQPATALAIAVVPHSGEPQVGAFSVAIDA
jgi:AIR synthase related protein, N-terminal domain